MPNYEYQCTQCAHRFEIWQSVGQAAPACPECGAAVRKVFHPPRVIFKGSGFYVTDLRAEKEKAKEAGAKATAKGEATGGASDGSAAPSESSSGSAGGASSTPSTADGGASAADKPGASSKPATAKGAAQTPGSQSK